MKKHEPAIIHVIELLKEARDICVRARAPKTAARVRLALSSAKGARRNARAHDFRLSQSRIRVADLQRAVDETSEKMKGARRHER